MPGGASRWIRGTLDEVGQEDLRPHKANAAGQPTKSEEALGAQEFILQLTRPSSRGAERLRFQRYTTTSRHQGGNNR